MFRKDRHKLCPTVVDGEKCPNYEICPCSHNQRLFLGLPEAREVRRGKPGYKGSYAAAMQQIAYVGGQLHRTVAQFEPVQQPELIAEDDVQEANRRQVFYGCLLYTSPSPRDS